MADSIQHCTKYPLLYSFQILVHGASFVAGVTAHGKGLIFQEEDESWWFSGVQPGGIASTGATSEEASSEFRKTFREVLFDIALEATSYESFERQVNSFFHETDAEAAESWTEALDALRSGTPMPEAFLSSLERMPADAPRLITVERLDVPKSARMAGNIVDAYAIPLAQAA